MVGVFLIIVCGSKPALADESSGTRMDESAERIGNNFGELLKGMGQELEKVIGSEHSPESATAEQDKNKEAEHVNDKSGNGVKGK